MSYMTRNYSWKLYNYGYYSTRVVRKLAFVSDSRLELTTSQSAVAVLLLRAQPKREHFAESISRAQLVFFIKKWNTFHTKHQSPLGLWTPSTSSAF